MPLIETKDGIILDVADGLDPQGPEVRAAVKQERNRRFKTHMAAPEQQAKIAAQQASDKAEYDPTKGMSATDRIRANLGAGFTDLKMGVDQLRGKASGQDYRDKVARDRLLSSKTTGGRLLQGVGQALPLAGATLAAAAAVPAAAATTAAGAIGGGLTGLLAPTEAEDVGTGKAIGAGVGAVTGGLGNKYLPTLLPKAAGAVQRGAGAVADFGRRFTDKGREKLAARAFTDTVDDKGATIAALRRHRDVPGTLPTTGQITGNRGLLETERKLANTGGEAATELGSRAQVSNKARYENLADEFKGDPMAARQAASDFAEANKPKAFTQPFRPQPVLGEITRLKNLTSNTKEQAVLDNLADRVRAAASSRNPVDQLHKVRMTEIDDMLGTLAQSDKKLAGLLRKDLMGVKKALDNQMNKATDGEWGNFLTGYQELARVADQTEAGAALMTRVNQAAPDIGGTPNVSAVRQSVLRKELGAVDDFGNPRYSPTGAATVEDVLGSLDTAARTEGVRPAGSATAANIARPQQKAEQMLGPVMGKPTGGVGAPLRALTGGTLGATVGASMGGPGGAALGAIGGAGLEAAADKVIRTQSEDLARKLLAHYTDPGKAMLALKAAMQAGKVDFKLASAAANLLQQMPQGAMLGQAAGGAASALAAQQPAQAVSQ